MSGERRGPTEEAAGSGEPPGPAESAAPAVPHPPADLSALAEQYGLTALPVEGGLFRRTWAGPPDASGRPSGSAIIVLFSVAADGFSAMHRLPIDEVWHYYRGDPLELLLLAPDGSARIEVLGDAAAGARVQTVVPAGTWMGAQVREGGRWALCGTTMAPGFLPADYEGGDADVLAARYPSYADRIRSLCRPHGPLRMNGTDLDD